MINVVSQSSMTYYFSGSFQKKDGEDSSFSELLSDVADDLLKNAPDKWVTEAGFTADAVEAAAAFMQDELGIDVSKIEPTHEITPEQMDWLRSRHDFSTMRRYATYSFVNDSGQTQYGFKATPEYSNFMGDLMYIGAYTKVELTVELWVEPIDTRPGANSVISGDLFNSLNSDNSLLGTARAFVKHLENMFSFYDARSKDPLKAMEGDAEFAALIKEHYLPLNQQFFEFIDELIRSEDEQPQQNSAVPPIEDASEKLKEDFGKLAQA